MKKEQKNWEIFPWRVTELPLPTSYRTLLPVLSVTLRYAKPHPLQGSQPLQFSPLPGSYYSLPNKLDMGKGVLTNTKQRLGGNLAQEVLSKVVIL